MEEPEFERARCDIGLSAACEQATWYSLMNVIALCLGSGAGIPFEEEELRGILDWTGIGWSDLRLASPLPLKAVFRSGDPLLMRDFDQCDLGTWRWSPDTFDRTLVPQAQGWTVIAEIECAKWLGFAGHSEATAGEPCAWWRALGTLLWATARGQLDFAWKNMRDDRGLFVAATDSATLKPTDPSNDLADQACMLWACSDAASLAGRDDSTYCSDNSRDELFHCADALFQAIAEHKKDLLRASSGKVRAESTTISALTWYASTTEARDLKARCFWILRDLADDLVKAQDANEMVGNTIMDAAAALRALIEAFRVTRLRTYAECATKIFAFIESQWSARDGVYSATPMASEITYNADDIGVILGALNASRLFLRDGIDRETAGERMLIFFHRTVNYAGLQMSMPGASFLPGWFREHEPVTHFRHDSIPLPTQAGGRFGTAPVLAGELGYDPHMQVWSRRMIFDAPAAMRAVCEMLWMNSEAIPGFPEAKPEHPPTEIERRV